MKGGKAKADTRRGGDAKLSVKKGAAAKKGKPAKDPNKPKRPPSAFFVFMEDFRVTYKQKHPNNKFVAVVGKAGGEKWKSLNDEEKAPFIQKAEKRKADYEKSMNTYNKKLTKLLYHPVLRHAKDSQKVIGSFAPAVERSGMPVVPRPSNQAFQPQAYPPYASLPTHGASPQPLWLQPPQMGGMRPPFSPYPPAYPSPFGLVARGALPFVPVPDAQPPGITPVNNLGVMRTSSVTAPRVQMVPSSVMQPEVPPHGTGLTCAT